MRVEPLLIINIEGRWLTSTYLYLIWTIQFVNYLNSNIKDLLCIMCYLSGAVLLYRSDLHLIAGFSHTLNPTALTCTAFCALDCTAPTCNRHAMNMQWTAGFCYTLHPTELTCNAFWWTALRCDAMNCTAFHCAPLQCPALHCNELNCAKKLFSPQSVTLKKWKRCEGVSFYLCYFPNTSEESVSPVWRIFFKLLIWLSSLW